MPKICPILTLSIAQQKDMCDNRGFVQCEENNCSLYDEENQVCSLNCKSIRNIELYK